ncbi:MAG: 50S ribosomal protein L29 [Myxococcales bacterium]|nr:MAG: 50S ribosomal protein L29 [Myxococcales bacterium]
MKTIDLRGKSVDDLKAELFSLKDELFRLKFQHATGQLENKAQIPRLKRNIARVVTVLRERELGINERA